MCCFPAYWISVVIMWTACREMSFAVAWLAHECHLPWRLWFIVLWIVDKLKQCPMGALNVKDILEVQGPL